MKKEKEKQNMGPVALPSGHLTTAIVVAVLFLFIFFLPISAVDAPSATVEAIALLQFKRALGNPSSLSSWSPNTSPCGPNAQWLNVICINGLVVALRLDNLGLSGQLDPSPLRQLPGLRSLSLAANSLSGPFPKALTSLTNLRAIYLQRNHFSGPLPPDIFNKLRRLRKLSLAKNEFTGPIPPSVTAATRLTELRLEGNQLSGMIPDLVSLKVLKHFNVSHNELDGKIPSSLDRFDATAFTGNPGLCGSLLGNKECNSPPSQPPSSPSELEKKGSGTIKILLIAAIVLLICSIALWLVSMLHGRQHNNGFQTLNKTGDESLRGPGRRKSRSAKHNAEAGNVGELVMVNQRKGVIRMSDLMTAVADVLGNGGLGSVFKVVMRNDMVVAVKRIKEMNHIEKEMFEAELRRIGGLNHPNVLPPLAYHFNKEEKLLVTEFVPKGTLLYILHGDRGADNAALDWPTRLKIIIGIARGMGYIHVELASLDIPHGNLKSGNILLGPNFDPVIVDYGYMSLVNPSRVSNIMFAYRSPEALQQQQVSAKSDVYCLGIIILELLTGKFPSQYLNNTKGGTDVVEWAHSAVNEGKETELLDPAISSAKLSISNIKKFILLGLVFVEPNPEKRPDMKEAVARVEEAAAAIASMRFKTEAPTTSDGNHETYVRDACNEDSAQQLGSIGERSI